jgi:hypothetical protein
MSKGQMAPRGTTSERTSDSSKRLTLQSIFESAGGKEVFPEMNVLQEMRGGEKRFGLGWAITVLDNYTSFSHEEDEVRNRGKVNKAYEIVRSAMSEYFAGFSLLLTPVETQSHSSYHRWKRDFDERRGKYEGERK